MDKRDILQSIIDNGGSCEALGDSGYQCWCQNCPMSKLKTRPDGTYLSCWDSLTDQLFPATMYFEEIYLEKAIQLLSDIVMEDILLGDDIAKDPREDT